METVSHPWKLIACLVMLQRYLPAFEVRAEIISHMLERGEYVRLRIEITSERSRGIDLTVSRFITFAALRELIQEKRGSTSGCLFFVNGT